MTIATMYERPRSSSVLGRYCTRSDATLWFSLYEKPKFPCDQLPEVGQVLQRQGLVEPVLLVEGRDLRRVGARPKDVPRHPSTRNDVEQDEHDQRDPDRDQDRLKYPPDDVAEHWLLPRPDAH